MNQKTIMRAVLTAVLSLVATTATAHDFEGHSGNLVGISINHGQTK